MNTVVSSSVVSGVISVAVVFLTKTWISERLKSSIQHEYSQKLESFKATVKAQNDVEIERLKSQLAIVAAEHNLRFSRQYEQMAVVIAETYRQTSELYLAVARYVTPAEFDSYGSKADRRKVVDSKLSQFSDYFYIKRLYLPHDTASKVECFRNSLHDVATEFAYKVEEPESIDGSSKIEN